jgi:AcrR family transcriptional regulator
MSGVISNRTDGRSARGEARRQAFLAAARDVFFEQGFGAASVNEVVRRAGGSLVTLYAQFGSKEGLFLAMLEIGVDEIMRPLQEVAAAQEPISQGLQRIGEVFLRRMLKPESVALYRIILAEGRTHPHLMQSFMAKGPERIRAALRAYFEERRAAGEVRAVDPDWAASFFSEMVRARHHLAAIADPAYAISDEELSAHVARAVDLLVEGLRPR